MAIGHHHPEKGEAGFVALVVFVALAVVAATVVAVNGSHNRGGPLMARSNILYPVGK